MLKNKEGIRNKKVCLYYLLKIKVGSNIWVSLEFIGRKN